MGSSCSGARSHAGRKVLHTATNPEPFVEFRRVPTMKLWSHYHLAHSVDEVLSLLSQYDGQVQSSAGGTDLLLKIKQANHPPAEALIDIPRIKELTAIETDGNGLTLGAAATHTAIVDQFDIRGRATCLAE